MDRHPSPAGCAWIGTLVYGKVLARYDTTVATPSPIRKEAEVEDDDECDRAAMAKSGRIWPHSTMANPRWQRTGTRMTLAAAYDTHEARFRSTPRRRRRAQPSPEGKVRGLEAGREMRGSGGEKKARCSHLGERKFGLRWATRTKPRPVRLIVPVLARTGPRARRFVPRSAASPHVCMTHPV